MTKDAAKTNGLQTLLDTLHQTLSQSRGFIKDNDESFPSRTVLKTYTDNILYAEPILDDGESELGHAITQFGDYQVALAVEGIFVRGALTVGDICADDDIVFGPALLEAHDLEMNEAVSPRIILSESAASLARAHTKYYADRSRAPQNSDLAADPDGSVYINYIEASLPAYTSETRDSWRGTCAAHRTAVLEQLARHKDNRRIWEKYAWVARYHNFAVERLYDDCASLVIAPEEILPKPSTLLGDS